MRNLSNVKRVVIKIGSSSLVNSDLSVNEKTIESLMKAFNNLKKNGIDCALVTSGAIALGMHELKLDKKPSNMSLKQACAAVGQAKLMESYNRIAAKYGLILGQILISHDDFQVRKRMLILSNTLDSMFKNNIIPIINENDAIAIDEIKVGDNDTLASLISPMVCADLLILFSDIDGLYDKNPKLYKDAKLINTVEKIDDSILAMVSGATSNVGTGGMETKIDAAISSSYSGINMIICNSNVIDELYNIVNGKEIGTLFKKSDKGISKRDQWIIFKSNALGSIYVDLGLENRLNDKKVSILPRGIKKIDGEFLSGAIINIMSSNGEIIGKGISNYSSSEVRQIMGIDSKELERVLGYIGKKEVIHANDLVLLKDGYYGHFVK